MKNYILGGLLVASLIINGDLATRLVNEQRAHEIDQARVEVLEVQASDKEKILELHDTWFFEYIETGYIRGLDGAVKMYQERGTQQGIENSKGGKL